MEERQQRGAVSGMLVGGMLAAGLTVLACGGQPWATPGALAVLGAIAFAVGALFGFTSGAKGGRRPPVLFRGYSPSRGTVRVWFRNPEFGAQVVEATRAKAPTGT